MRIYFVLISLLLCSALVKAEQGQVKVVQLAPNVYQHISYLKLEVWGLVPASGLIYVSGQDAYLIDTPWTQEGTEQLIEWLKEQKLNLKGAIVSHHHKDASGGLSYLHSLGVKTYAHGLTNELLTKLKREPANVSVDDSYTLLDGQLEIFYPGGGHAKDNVVVWLPEAKLMFGGCFVKSAKSRSLGNLEDAVVEEWSASIDKVLQRYKEADVVVPGHGKVGDLGLLTHTQSLVKANQTKR